MKTKHLCMLLLATFMLEACEKSVGLSAPTGLQGRQMGDDIVLAWNRVEGAVSYVIERNGTYLMSQTSTTYTDNNPSDGYNSYEVYAKNASSRSQSAYVNIFFEKKSSGGNNGGGGSNPDNNGGHLDYTNQNISGIWKSSLNRQMQLNENYFTFEANGNVQGVEIGSDYAYIYTGKYKFQGDNLIITYSKYEYYANGKVQSTIKMNEQYTYRMSELETGWMVWNTSEYEEILLYPANSITWPANISTSTYQSVVGTWERTDITYSSDVEYIYLGGDGVYKNVYKVNANTIVRMGKWSATSSSITVNLIDGAEISGGLLQSHKNLGWTDNLDIISVSSSQLKIKNGGFTQTYKKVSSIGITY